MGPALTFRTNSIMLIQSSRELHDRDCSSELLKSEVVELIKRSVAHLTPADVGYRDLKAYCDELRLNVDASMHDHAGGRGSPTSTFAHHG